MGNLPNDLKNKGSVDSFKTTIKKWRPESSPRCLCKTYLQNTGYLVEQNEDESIT